MAETIFWLLAIAFMTCFLINCIYELVNRILKEKAFKKYTKELMKTLDRILEIEYKKKSKEEEEIEVIEDSETEFKVGDRVKVKRLTKGYGTIEKIDKELGAYINFDNKLGAYINFDNDESIIGYHDTYYNFNELEREEK